MIITCCCYVLLLLLIFFVIVICSKTCFRLVLSPTAGDILSGISFWSKVYTLLTDVHLMNIPIHALKIILESHVTKDISGSLR